MLALFNRADIEKDAQVKPSILKNELYNTCADYLFGSIEVSHKEAFNFLEKDLDKRARMGKTEIYPKTRISTLRHPLDAHVMFLPDRVSFAVQDSGLSPSDFGNLVNIITPASYLDSAPRSKHTTQLFGFDKIIPKSVFQKMIGISQIESLTSHIDVSSMSCNIDIQFLIDGRKYSIRVKFNDALKPVSGNVDFFMGNPTKNKWFQTAASAPPEQKDIGCIYLLCKLMGDALLAYYGKEFERTLPDGGNRVCAFTYDKAFALRCRVLQLPVVLKDHEALEKELHECVYFPSPGIVDKDIKELFCRFVTSHNASVVQTIHYAVNSGNILFGTQRYKISSKILQYILEFIEGLNMRVKEIDSTYMTIPEYKNIINKYLANHIFTQSGVYYMVRHGETRLSEGFSGLEKAKNIGGLLQQCMSGGGTSEIEQELYEAIFDAVSYADTSDPKNFILDSAYDVQLRQRIYFILSQSASGIKKSDHVLQTEDIFNYLYRRFLFVGGFLLNMDFLKGFVDIYKKKGHEALYEVTYTDFEHKYEDWKAKHLKYSEIDSSESPIVCKTAAVLAHGGHRKTYKRKRKVKT